MKEGDSFERDVLKTVLGEIQTLKARTGKMDDDRVINVFKKFKQGVLDTIKIMEAGGIEEHPEELDFEIDIYDKYIPKTMPIEDIVSYIKGNDADDSVINAKSDGQATGMAMKLLRMYKVPTDGKDVAEAVKMLRK